MTRPAHVWTPERNARLAGPRPRGGAGDLLRELNAMPGPAIRGRWAVYAQIGKLRRTSEPVMPPPESCWTEARDSLLREPIPRGGGKRRLREINALPGPTVPSIHAMHQRRTRLQHGPVPIPSPPGAEHAHHA